MITLKLIPFPVVFPLLIAAVLAGIGSFFNRKFIEVLSLSTVGGVAYICYRLLLSSLEWPLVYWFGGWLPRGGIALGISFYVDPIAAGMALMVSLLMLGSFMFSWRYFKNVKGLFHALMLVFMASMCGFCLSGDLFNLFVWFELMSAAAIALCGYKSDEVKSLNGAINFAVTNTVGAFLSLSGIALLYSRTGALNLAQVAHSLASQPFDSLMLTSFLFFSSGFLVKAAVVPFHFWLADAHAVAPTPVSVLFSGIMVELGLYAVARVYWVLFSKLFSFNDIWISHLFLTVGISTAIVGAVLCYIQRHIKRLLAFSTISHMGLMVIAFALLDSKAFTGLAFYWIGHGFIKASLFLLAGILLHRFETVDEYELRGKGSRLLGTRFLFFFQQ